MPYSEWKDNEYIEKLVKELKDNGTNVVVGTLDNIINWGRSNSIWPLTFATSCCGIEFIALGAARYCALWLGSGTCLTTSGRLHDGSRNDRSPHGSGGASSLRSARRAQVCDCLRWMRNIGRSVQELLSRSEGCRGDNPRRCLRARMSASSRSNDLRYNAALTQN